MPNDVTQPKVPGPNTVRAWFDTFFSDFLRRLEFEQDMLRRRNWSFRFRPIELQSILPLREYTAAEYWRNVDQFKRIFPEFAVMEAEHDQRVDALLDACRGAYELLSTNPRLVGVLENLISKYSIETLEGFFGAYPREDWLGILAEHIINNSGNLPSHYGIARLWNANRSEILAEASGLPAEARPRMDAAGEDLMKASLQVHTYLEESAHHLAESHDVPFALPDHSAGRARI